MLTLEELLKTLNFQKANQYLIDFNKSYEENTPDISLLTRVIALYEDMRESLKLEHTKNNASSKDITTALQLVELQIISAKIHLYLNSNNPTEFLKNQFTEFDTQIKSQLESDAELFKQTRSLVNLYMAAFAAHIFHLIFEEFQTTRETYVDKFKRILSALSFINHTLSYDEANLDIDIRLEFLSLFEISCELVNQDYFIQPMSTLLVHPDTIESTEDKLDMLYYHHFVIQQGGRSCFESVDVLSALRDTLDKEYSFEDEESEEANPDLALFQKSMRLNAQRELEAVINLIRNNPWCDLPTKKQYYSRYMDKLDYYVLVTPLAEIRPEDMVVFIELLREGFEKSRDFKYLDLMQNLLSYFSGQLQQSFSNLVCDYLKNNKKPGLKEDNPSVSGQKKLKKLRFAGLGEMSEDTKTQTAFKSLFLPLKKQEKLLISQDFAATVLKTIALLVLEFYPGDDSQKVNKIIIAYQLFQDALAFKPSYTLKLEIELDMGDLLARAPHISKIIAHYNKRSHYRKSSSNDLSRLDQLEKFIFTLVDELSNNLSEVRSVEEIDTLIDSIHRCLLDKLADYRGIVEKLTAPCPPVRGINTPSNQFFHPVEISPDFMVSSPAQPQ